jgi:hypothetical protein
MYREQKQPGQRLWKRFEKPTGIADKVTGNSIERSGGNIFIFSAPGLTLFFSVRLLLLLANQMRN